MATSRIHLAFAFFITPALASVEPPLSLESLLDTPVVSASLTEESLRSAPGTVLSIGHHEIQTRGYRHLSDVLADIPGILISKAVDPRSFDRAVVRGLQGNNKILILLDGVRISAPTGERLPLSSNIGLEGIERVEVVLGPGSTLYGADSLAATVNLISEKTLDNQQIDLRVGQRHQNSLSGSLGTRLTDGVVFRFDFGLERGRDTSLAEDYPNRFRLGDLIRLDNSLAIPSQDRSTPSFETRAERWHAHLQHDQQSLGWHHQRFRFPTSTGALPNSVHYDLQPFWDFSQDTVYWRDLWTLSSAWAAQFSAEYSRFELDPKSSFVNVFTGFDPGYKFARSSRQTFKTIWTRTTPSPHQWIFGASVDNFDALPKTQDLPVPFDPDRPAASQPLFHPGSNGTLPIDIFNVEYQNYGAFAQVKSHWSDRTNTVLALRYDDNSRYDSVVNARLAWTYKASQDITVKWAAGSAYLAPSPELAYEHFGSFAFQRNDGLYESFFFQVPNPNLKPEKLLSTELGFDWQMQPSLLLGVQLYHNQLDDLILFSPTQTPQSNFIPGGNIQFTTHNANVGTVSTTGLSATLRGIAQLGSGTLDWWVTGDWLDGSIEGPQGRSDAPYSADAMIKLGLAYSHNAWSEYLRCEAIQSPHGDGVNEVNRTGKGHVTCDLGIVWDGGKNHGRWRLDVHNLTDARYYAVGEGGATVFFNVPQPKRWLELSWQHGF